jgi:hypothetical protein
MHRIIFSDGERELESTTWDRSLNKGKKYARDYFRIRQARLVQIIDTEKREIVFSFGDQAVYRR